MPIDDWTSEEDRKAVSDEVAAWQARHPYPAMDFDEAVASLEQAIALKPDFAGAHNNLGYILSRELGDVERGAEHIRIALRLTPPGRTLRARS